MKQIKNPPKNKLKKLAKWSIGTLLVVLIALVSLPFLFKDKIVQMVTNTVNKNIHATVSFADSDLSFFRNFPLASIRLKDVVVLNKAPFAGDTLYAAEDLRLDMNITELFKSTKETLQLKSMATTNAEVHIKINANNEANYDIAIKKTATDTTANNNALALDIQSYRINNSVFTYTDATNGVQLKVSDIFHTGKGNFANAQFDLTTSTKAKLSIQVDSTRYLEEIPVTLEAVLGLDIKNTKYTFKENTGYINQLPLKFNGFIQLLGDQQEYDITFTTPTSSFTNALALLPKAYTGNLNTISTQGNFNLEGNIRGTLSENTIPTFAVTMKSNNAQFQYQALPKTVRNIHINATVKNTTGKSKDTYVAVENLGFTIDQDVFNAKGSITNVTTNPTIGLTANGTINLANIAKVYPLQENQELSGILTANVRTNFNMNAVKNKQYQSITNEGTLRLQNFTYKGDDVANTFYIDKTTLEFNTNTIQLKELIAKTGTSDLSMNGKLANFYGFVFNDETLEGNFALTSKNLAVNDFLAAKTTDTTSQKSTLKIPSFLDIQVQATADNVLYDNIALKNVRGNLSIQEENITLQNLQTEVFGGKIGLKGKISTQKQAPKFDLSLDLNALSIAESFNNVDMLKSIAPIAGAVEGKISSTLNVSGLLKEDMTPNLTTISGNLFGKFLEAQLKASNSKVLKAVGSKVDFLNLSNIDLNKISTLITFKDGSVDVTPFAFNVKEIGIKIGGKHGFDNRMNYDITFDVPVKYLGTEVTKLIQKLTPKDASEIQSIPVNATLTGQFSSPNFTTNIQQATSNLMQTLVEKQKQQLKKKGKDKLKELIGIDAKKDSVKKDSVKTRDKVKSILGGLFGKKKKDSVN